MAFRTGLCCMNNSRDRSIYRRQAYMYSRPQQRYHEDQLLRRIICVGHSSIAQSTLLDMWDGEGQGYIACGTDRPLTTDRSSTAIVRQSAGSRVQSARRGTARSTEINPRPIIASFSATHTHTHSRASIGDGASPPPLTHSVTSSHHHAESKTLKWTGSMPTAVISRPRSQSVSTAATHHHYSLNCARQSSKLKSSRDQSHLKCTATIAIRLA